MPPSCEVRRSLAKSGEPNATFTRTAPVRSPEFWRRSPPPHSQSPGEGALGMCVCDLSNVPKFLTCFDQHLPKGNNYNTNRHLMRHLYGLDIFENPYEAPDPRSHKTPQQQKKKFQKTRKPRLSPKVNVRSPKVNVRSPKVNVLSPKVNIKYL